MDPLDPFGQMMNPMNPLSPLHPHVVGGERTRPPADRQGVALLLAAFGVALGLLLATMLVLVR